MTNDLADRRRIEISLLALRAGVLIVMLMWTLDKLIHPDHAAAVFENFYGLSGLGSGLMTAIGIAELILLALFAAGVWKRLTYGLVFLFHGISTLSSYQQYLEPFDNLLFFAAWPMLAACLALYLLRDQDRLLTWGRLRGQD